MKVKWEDFAKRRSVSVSYFVSNMSYSEYERWCEIRSVIPIKKSMYIHSETPTPQKTSAIQEPVVTTEEPDWTKLSKGKKSIIVSLCDKHEIEYKLSDTKKVLISKLKNFYAI